VNRSHHQELLHEKIDWLAAGAAAMLMLAMLESEDPAEQAIANIDSSLDAITITARNTRRIH